MAVEPLPPQLLAELVEEPVERVEEALDELAQSYERERRGFVLARIAGGARLQTHPDLAPYVERFANREVSHRLSTAALETLAIVAYRQPVSRGQISALRGVNVDGVTPAARAAGLHRGGRPRRRSRASRRSSAPPTSSWSVSGSTRWTSCRRWRTSSPGPRWPGDLERDLQSALGLGLEAASDDA